MTAFVLKQLHRIKRVCSIVIREVSYILINKIVTHIPSWTIRKIFYLISGMKIGKGTRINAGAIIDTPRNVIIGNHCVINENSYLDGRGGLIIGNNVSISIYAKVITASHYVDSETFEYYNDPVRIEDNVWIGVGAIILNGSILHENAVIGAGCTFKGIADKNGIYIGNPSRKIRERKLEEKYELHNLLFFR